MITIRSSRERGHTNLGWLDSYHTFSFGAYRDPGNLGFHSLRVINDDRVQPGMGFGSHPHRDMEIITYVLDGSLKHKDSMGNTGVIKAGDVQRMSAGTGIIHSEFNASRDEPVHLFQIWIEPNRAGLPPSYEQKSFGADGQAEKELLASSDGRDGSVTIHQDAKMWRVRLGHGQSLEHALPDHRAALVQVVSGNVECNGQMLGAGDSARVEDEPALRLRAVEASESLLFELSATGAAG